jgi:hypothetical protein
VEGRTEVKERGANYFIGRRPDCHMEMLDWEIKPRLLCGSGDVLFSRWRDRRCTGVSGRSRGRYWIHSFYI